MAQGESVSILMGAYIVYRRRYCLSHHGLVNVRFMDTNIAMISSVSTFGGVHTICLFVTWPFISIKGVEPME